MPDNPDPTLLQRYTDPPLESALLGALLAEGALPAPLLPLCPADFYLPLHRALWTAASALHEAGQAVDDDRLLDCLARDGLVHPGNDRATAVYLATLPDLRPAPDELPAAARRLVELAAKRRLCLETLRFSASFLHGDLADASAEELRDRQIARLRALPLSPPRARASTWADLHAEIAPIQWDWMSWLPRGFLVLLAGESGVGKSILALRLAASYLRGDPWPDGNPFASSSGERAAVLWCEAEAAQALNLDRATRWGLPLDRVYAPFEGQHSVQLYLPVHRAEIARLAHRPEVRLVIVDSLSAAIRGGENAGRGLDAVVWLAELARDAGLPVLLLHHLRKRAQRDAERGLPSPAVTLDRLRGHSSIVQPARLVLALDAPDLTQPHLKRLAVIKSNLAPFPPPLGFYVDAAGEARFADPPLLPRATSMLELATEALRDLLGPGPLPATDALRQLSDLGLSKTTIHRAKARLGVHSRRLDNHWLWELPRQELPPPLPPIT